MARDTAGDGGVTGAARVSVHGACHTRLGGYPDWDRRTLEDARAVARQLTESQRRARIAGSEIDAALNDPRWTALEFVRGWD